MEDLAYLESDIVVEPLYNNWYAWGYLIAPATSCFFTKNLHIPLLDSFITAPELHIEALKDKKMRGGPFISHSMERINDIERLLEQTKTDLSESIQFATSFAQLNKQLQEADGHSLTNFYNLIPQNLQGLVELVYDINNNPHIRIIERALYQSHYYRKDLQSLLIYKLDPLKGREFALNTPRFKSNVNLAIKIPFCDGAIDDLAQMRTKPAMLGEISEQLNITHEEAQILRTFVNKGSLNIKKDIPDEGVRIRYFGHACILIETPDCAILSDPIISYDHKSPSYNFYDLPDKIDYVILTHQHQDHLIIETLLQIRFKIKNIVIPRSNNGNLVDPSIKLLLSNLGFRSVIELEEHEQLDIFNGSIIGLPFFGEHADLNIHSKLAYYVQFGSNKILIAADSNNLMPSLYDRIAANYGACDILFLGMECEGAPLNWLYGPLLPPLPQSINRSRRLDACNFERARSMVESLKPKEVYIYAMGQEPWLSHLMHIDYNPDSIQMIEVKKLVEFCTKLGIKIEVLYLKKQLLLGSEV